MEEGMYTSHHTTCLNFRYHHGKVYKEPWVSLGLVEGGVRGGWWVVGREKSMGSSHHTSC